MTAILATLADAVATQINAASFGAMFTFQAGREYADFELDLSDEGVLHVDVVPATHETELANRVDSDWASAVDIGLRYKFPQSENEAATGRIDPDLIDELVALTEEIITYLQSEDARRLTAYDVATWKNTKLRTIAPGNVLRKQRQFLAIIRVTYDVNP